MPPFRTKPVTVEAIQYDGTFQSQHAIRSAFGSTGSATPNEDRSPRPMFIDTLVGPLRVDPGDWMVRGASGLLFPVSDALFRATYEPAPAAPNSTHAA